MKRPVTQKNTQDQFMYDMIIRKDLIRRASREFIYARYLYSLPVADLTDMGFEMRFSFYELLQLTMAKLFVDRPKTHKYNLHRLLRDFQTEPFLHSRITGDSVQPFIDQLAIFRSTIRGLQTVRDEWIAHTDELGGVAPYGNFFPVNERLLNLGFEILNAFSQAVLQVPVPNILSLVDINKLSVFVKKNSIPTQD